MAYLMVSFRIMGLPEVPPLDRGMMAIEYSMVAQIEIALRVSMVVLPWSMDALWLPSPPRPTRQRPPFAVVCDVAELSSSHYWVT